MDLYSTISWGSLANNVLPYYNSGTFVLNTYTIYVYPLDINESGADDMLCDIGDYFIDHLGYPFEILHIATSGSGKILRIYDLSERSTSEYVNHGPYPGRIGYVYKPLNGAIILSQAQLNKMDLFARDRINNIEKGVIWANRGISIFDGVDYTDNITRVELSNNLSLGTSGEDPWLGGLIKKIGVLIDGTDNCFLVKNSSGGITNSGYTFSTNTSLSDASNSIIASSLAIKTYIDNTATSGNILDAVIRMVINNTFDPGTPTTGDRYIAETITLHANFGTISGLGLHDIIEYNGSNFAVIFDASVATAPATVTVGVDKNDELNHQWTYNIVDDVWIDRGAVVNHNDLGNLNTGDYLHLTALEFADLTDFGDCEIHYHSTDRNRTNHTGTQLSSTIYDLAETIQDAVASQIQNDAYLTWSYNDTSGALTPSINVAAINYWSKSGSNLYYNSGNVGIGRPNPAYKLDVSGTGRFTASVIGVTESLSDNSTKFATTAFVKGQNYITLTSLNSTATGLTYANTTGVFSLTSGYSIPTTTKQSEWDASYGWGNHSGLYATVEKILYNDQTLGNNVDFNAITYSGPNLLLSQPFHVPNYTGQTNYPSPNYGQIINFNASSGLSPAQLAFENQGDLFYRCKYTGGSSFNWNGVSWIKIVSNYSFPSMYPDLNAIETISGTSGFLKKTAANTWTLDTNTYLTSNQIITLSGDISGSGATSISTTLANSGVTAGTYNNSATQVRPFTVDSKGRLTAIGTAVTITPSWFDISSKPTTISGFGITDAYTKTESNNKFVYKDSFGDNSFTQDYLVFNNNRYWDDFEIFIKDYISFNNDGVFLFNSSQTYNNTSASASVKAQSFIKQNGTSSQFLKADGSVDSNAYVYKNQTSVSSASSITPTGNYFESEYYVTALAANLTINAPSGIALNGNNILLRIKDNGTSRTITWNSIYRGIGIDLEARTTVSKIMYVGMIYNSTNIKWDVVSIIIQE